MVASSSHLNSTQVPSDITWNLKVMDSLHGQILWKPTVNLNSQMWFTDWLIYCCRWPVKTHVSWFVQSWQSYHMPSDMHLTDRVCLCRKTGNDKRFMFSCLSLENIQLSELTDEQLSVVHPLQCLTANWVLGVSAATAGGRITGQACQPARGESRSRGVE